MKLCSVDPPPRFYALRCILNYLDSFNIFRALLFDSPLFVAEKWLVVGKSNLPQYPPRSFVRKAG